MLTPYGIAPILPTTLRTASDPHAPAVPSLPSVQARKRARLFENSIGLNGFYAGPRPFRAWALGTTGEAGAWGRDEIREIEGALQRLPQPRSGYIWQSAGLTGAFSTDNNSELSTTSMGGGSSTSNPTKVLFKASNVVPTGPLNVPPHVWQPIIIYLGRPR